MEKFELKVYKNKLITKQDCKQYVLDILEPLKDAFVRDGTRMHLSNSSSYAPDEVSGIEGLCRAIWGISVLDDIGPDHEWWIRVRKALVNGTDPKNANYFGDAGDYDQRLVEMAAIGFAFALRADCIYDPLSVEQKNNLINWLNQINTKKACECNWKFFRVVVNIGFKCLGIPYDEHKMAEYLDDLDEYYVEEGWYYDGEQGTAHADYYVPFAMHFYGLFYAKYMRSIDSKRAEVYCNRANAFAKQFIYWFSCEGASIPYGRSLTYRFAQVGFWSMLALTECSDHFDYGVIKGIILRNLRWWNDQPIFNKRGELTIGYTYENRTLVEDYTAPGSVYWALKAFAFLALPDEHPFWQAEEKPLPILEASKVQPIPKLVIKRDQEGKHLLAYNSGYHHTNAHSHVECKYEKFVYSSLFGFSVPRSHKKIESAALDNTLGISEDGSYYRHKEKSIKMSITDELIYSKWSPMKGVIIDTYLVLGFPWHIRVHLINTNRQIEACEGGFAIGLESMQSRSLVCDSKVEDKSASIWTLETYSMIKDLSGNQEAILIKSSPNTNLMNPRTVIPTLKSVLEPGCHVLASYVMGDYGQMKFNQEAHLEVENDGVKIHTPQGKQISIPTTSLFY